MSENHTDFLIKQTLRSLAHISRMGLVSSTAEPLGVTDHQKDLSADEGYAGLFHFTDIHNLLNAKSLFALPNDVTSKELEQNILEESNSQHSDKIILNAFLKEVRNAKPVAMKNWSALQHYVYFIYRHVISNTPCNSNDIFSSIVTKRVRELVEGLILEDKTQLSIRLVTLIREYAIIARGHFERIDPTSSISNYLVCLMSYYSAFCSAASKLAPLLPEFDFLIMDRFHINWLCLNKSIFYHYVYLSCAVQSKIPDFYKLQEEKVLDKKTVESYECFCEDMKLIAARWGTLRFRISTLSKKLPTDDSSCLMQDFKKFQLERILKTNYWIIRSSEEMDSHDISDLDSQILSLIGDMKNIADFLIDPTGNCICEDCLAAEFRNSNMPASVSLQPQSPGVCRLLTCYLCQDPIILDALGSHIVTKHSDNTSQKSPKLHTLPHQKKGIPVKKVTTKLSKMLNDSIDLAKVKETSTFKFTGDLAIKIATELGDLKTFKEPSVNRPTRVNSAPTLRDDVHDKSNFDYYSSILNESEIKSAIVNESILKIPKDSIFKISQDNLLKMSNDHLSKSVNGTVFPILKPSNESLFKTANEVIFKSTGESAYKIASESPIIKSASEMFKASSKSNDEVVACKVAFDDFIKNRNDTPDAQACRIAFDDYIKKKSDEMNKKSVEFLNKKIGEFNGEAPCKKRVLTSPVTVTNSPATSTTAVPNACTKSNANSCAGHSCGHKCKQEQEKELKKSTCQDGCDHYKEPRKCDCAYCEVFGSSVPSHTHKTNETRDRLRTRLNQRKEKLGEAHAKTNPKGTAGSKVVARASIPINDLPTLNTNVKATTGCKNISANPICSNIKNSTDSEYGSTIKAADPTNHLNSVRLNVKPPDAKPNLQLDNVTKNIAKLSTAAAVKLDNTPSAPILKHVVPAPKIPEPPPPHRRVSSLSTCSLNSQDDRDINDLLNFIEGNKPIDKIALAQKKAAKKARQKMKKEQERIRLEDEERRKEQERIKQEKKKEEERLRLEALCRQQNEKQKRNKKSHDDLKVQTKSEQKSNKKNKKKGNVQEDNMRDVKSNSIEETIPAMVTIKRVTENINCPPKVTITLKGSTPDQDKLLFTLVNGQNNKEKVATATIVNKESLSNSKKNKKHSMEQIIKLCPEKSKNNNESLNSEKTTKKKKKKSNVNTPNGEMNMPSNEFKVTITVDKGANKVNQKSAKQNDSHKITKAKESERKANEKVASTSNKENDVNLPMLRLPPGITITKIEGPPTNRNCKIVSNLASTSISMTQNHNHNHNVPVSKSGVILVDTEKLIQQSIHDNLSKKNKKKKKKQEQQLENSNKARSANGSTMNSSGPSMVTLKNPIFQSLQSQKNLSDKVDVPVFSNDQQASIIKNENGMVTIRSPRLQQSFENGTPLPNLLTDLKPVIGPDVATPYISSCHASFFDNVKRSNFSAQEILSGLPGIEITKIDKNSVRNDHDHKKGCQAADVSIIPTCNGVSGGDKFNFDKDDWPYESVFAPKDILEDDMDADERELEAFKRFCQQSVPPKRKEKVAHLNVKDIVLKKKKDVTYS